MSRRSLLALSLALFGWALPSLAAAQASLVRDVNPLPADGSSNSSIFINNFLSLGPRAVFIVSRRTGDLTSFELWATDGTDAGTERILAFPEGSGPGFLASNGRLAFYTSGSSFVPEMDLALWRTDGTEEGTFRLVSGLASYPESAFVGGSLVFSGCQIVQGTFRCEPWVSDGTVAGTRRLRDITPGEYGSNPRSFVTVGGLVYFFADAPDGTGLWRTDGTPQGTRRAALLPVFARPINLTAAGSRLFFRVGAADFSTTNALWTSDGTQEGTRPVPPFDRPRGKGPGAGPYLGTLGNTLVFVGFDPVLGTEVYRSDGTARGTVRLTSFPKASPTLGPGASLGARLVFVGPDQRLWTTAGTRASTRALAPLALATEFNFPVFFVTQGRAVFAGSTLGPEKDMEPWVTDGTPGGTFRLADLCAGDCNTFLLFGATLLGQVQFYSGGDLWGTDGTLGGTRLLAQGAYSPNSELPVPRLATVRRRLVFAGFDPEAARQNKFDLELKVTNGTPEGTRTLDLFLANGNGSDPKGFTPLGDAVFFFACAEPGSLWKTDGTPETTVSLGAGRVFCTDPALPIVLDGIAYFRAFSPKEFWYEVWRSDGTPAGTYPISHVGPAMDVTALTALDGELFFFTDVVNGDVSTAVSTLWRSDGTPTGTAEVFKLDRRYSNSLATVGGKMFFVAWLPPDVLPMLFVSDGTQAGTRPLVNANEAGDFVELGGLAFFLSGNQIWKTDGTPEGTRELLPPGNRVDIAADLAVFGGRLYFMGLDFTDPARNDGVPTLFRSDGTVAGTVRLKTFDKDDTGLLPEFPLPRFTVSAGALFFVANDKAHGSELWKTDGTPTGTVLVRDVRPGPASSRIGMMAPGGDRVFFAADDGVHGVELWTSDGTVSGGAGTHLAADVSEGPRSSFPREIVRIGDRVFFSADDGGAGREPWVLPLTSTLTGRIVP